MSLLRVLIAARYAGTQESLAGWLWELKNEVYNGPQRILAYFLTLTSSGSSQNSESELGDLSELLRYSGKGPGELLSSSSEAEASSELPEPSHLLKVFSFLDSAALDSSSSSLLADSAYLLSLRHEEVLLKSCGLGLLLSLH